GRVFLGQMPERTTHTRGACWQSPARQARSLNDALTVDVPTCSSFTSRRTIVYLTARSYLLAGFTAASIVAATSLAPRPTIHLPSIHDADIRLAAAETEIVSAVRTLRAV